jgi:hypothetical protein
MEDFQVIPDLDRPQILIAVTSPTEKAAIRKQLELWKKKPIQDYWFFI